MNVFLNDHAITCTANTSIKDLLLANDISLLNIAIAMDNAVIPKTQWDTTFVSDGSKLMIIKAVQGG